MFGGLICYLSAWLFLGLSGIYCYEEVNYNKKTQLFTLKKLEEEPIATETTSAVDYFRLLSRFIASCHSIVRSTTTFHVNVYEDMNIFSKVVRTVSYDEKLYGKNVFTGWIMISEGWVKIHDMQGNKLFDVEDVADAPVVNIPPEVYYEPATNGMMGTKKIFPDTVNPPARAPAPAPAVPAEENNGGEGNKQWVTAQNNNPYAYASSNRN